MRMSRLADYAIVLLTQMTADRGRLYTAHDLSVETAQPAPTVSKVLALLSRRGVVTSIRGVKGGYGLARDPRDVRVAEIIEAIDGPIAITDCQVAEGNPCEVQRLCPSRRGLHQVTAAILTALNTMTLADISLPLAFGAPVGEPAPQLRRPVQARTA
ncbi:MAG: SUF system Fe-S cluster assembly regulator [Kiloniellaceae bacterium]